MYKQVFITKSPQETENIAARLAASLKAGDLIALYGDLGAGKTAFVRGLACGLHCRAEDVTSPTYTILQTYPGRIPLMHFDMYRITSAEDLESTGYYDMLGTEAILAVEWPENIAGELPQRHYTVHLTAGAAETQRLIEIESPEEETEC
ncbi:MAG: tRNA (adenosine(37)-N6)-threonylcarbamoyltransferase complex ATPase subunit type 1 TsaE [Oscillospiraceae bacterium]|jgi:tRNA threonylcarbamoyladenosine biosynthesis protein TsaE|nr:tRNA (adenosine(37)-N6)-threonylcarbamoyltransferase complex ATPase subunit type 1 TsaE [Oscillospiraceae bacterium]